MNKQTNWTYHLCDNSGVSTEWNIPFLLTIGIVFNHEFGTYKVTEHKTINNEVVVVCDKTY